jgi:GNAT superfamily N-acetyltransferase
MSLSITPRDTAHRAALPSAIVDHRHWPHRLADGTAVLIRPLREDDRQRETDFIRGLSADTRRLRFLCDFRQPSEALIDQLMDVDDNRRVALVALADMDGQTCEVGISRYVATADPDTCECAVTVTDAWQRRGLGSRLMGHLIDEARRHGFSRMVSIDAAGNQAMRHLARSLGFRRRLDADDPSLAIHTLDLDA